MKRVKNNQSYIDPGMVVVASLSVVGVALLILSQVVSQPGAIFLSAIACLFAAFTLFPQLGLYLTVLALPLINWNFYVKGLIIPAVDLVAVISLFAFLFRALADKLFSTTEKVKIILPYAKYFFVFFIITLVSSAVSKYPGEAIWYSFRWILFFYLAYIVVPVNIINTEKRLRYVITLLVTSASVVALMGIASLFFQDWQNTFVRIQPILLFGIYPIGSNQNLIAEFLVVAVFSVLALKYWRGKVIRNKLITILSIVLALVALGTFSRAAWIVLAMGIFFYFIYQSKEFKRRYIIPALLSLIFIVPFAFYMVRLQSQFDIGVSSTENRLLLSQIAVSAWKEEPFFGKGSGDFYRLVEENIRFRAKYGEPLDSHGIWQKVLAENGGLGVISFAAFCLVLFYGIHQGIMFLRPRRELKLVLPLALGATAGFVFQFFNTSYYKGKMWLPIGLTLAAIYLYSKKKNEPSYGKEKN
ncbi:MAG: O-antigen ligase family protein [Candidatus Falkowbacteria bacterium]|nr:O-antigen ligase family protein [Candidatus Falkowbacteria bacterium]